MNELRRVLIVGGGVGGLTAATAFAQRGVEVVLIERRPSFDVPGVGLGQPANALRVYAALGVLPEVLAAGFNYDRMYIFDARRELIVDHKFLLGDETVPAVCALSRLRLHEILLAAAERAGVAIHTGLTVEEFHDEAGRATVTFSNGRTEIIRPGRRLRRHPLDDAAPSRRHCIRPAPLRLRRLAGAGAPGR